ncbi:MAG: hypothetical protein EOP19_26355, partial [Hyphomicrobiales bacterium]
MISARRPSGVARQRHILRGLHGEAPVCPSIARAHARLHAGLHTSLAPRPDNAGTIEECGDATGQARGRGRPDLGQPGTRGGGAQGAQGHQARDGFGHPPGQGRAGRGGAPARGGRTGQEHHRQGGADLRARLAFSPRPRLSGAATRIPAMNFASDNWAGATEAVMAAVQRHNGGFAPGYGDDPLTKGVGEKFSEVFERQVEVFFVGTGTAANAIAMAAAGRPGGLVFATTEAHIQNDEFGATEFYTGGMKIVPIAHRAGIMEVAALEATIARYGGRFGIPTALSLTNATECGTVYAPAEVAALAAIGKQNGLVVHMDGARFANAVAALGVSPAEVTWKAGVDMLSFGGTKNGCMMAEAVIVFE